MDIREGVVNVEVLLQVKSIDELPRVLVKHESSDQSRRLHLASLLASFKLRQVFEPDQSSAESVHLLDVLLDWNQLQSLVQIKVEEVGLSRTKVLRVDHLVVLLVLISVQIRDSPMRLVRSCFPLFISVSFSKLQSQELSFEVFLESR